MSNLIHWYFSKRTFPYWCIFLLDSLVVFLSALLVYVLNNGLFFSASHFGPLCLTIGIYLLCYMVSFRVFHTYHGIIRFSTFVDLSKVSQSILCGLLLSLLVRSLIGGADFLMPIRLRDMLLWSCLSLMIMWGIRVFVKFVYETYYLQQNTCRVFIYGTHEGGVSIARSIRTQEPVKYKVVGFVDDATDHSSETRLMGVKVYPNDDQLVDTMRRLKAEALFVSPLVTNEMRNNTAMIDRLINAGIKIYTIPSEVEWDGKSDINHSQLREVDIEDLLPRDKIEIDMEGIANLLKGKRVLITGAAGSIGAEITRQVAFFGPDQLICVDQAETPLHDIRLMLGREFPHIESHTIVGDIAHQGQMEDIFRDHRPEYVFHAAAYKHVPMMEDNPGESIRNNVDGTRIIADLAVKYDTLKFVMVSTDKAVNPTNVMGCSKRICEIYVQALDKAIKEGNVKGKTRFVTTRFGNVLGSNGSVIPLFKEQIRRGGPITVTHPEIFRYFMLISEACKLVLEAGTMGHGGEIYVFDMGEPVKIVDLAKRMIKLSGADIEIKFTGLRQGEKLYEEMLNEKECTLPTTHAKILVARVREYDYTSVKEDLRHLSQVARSAGDMEVVRHMKLIVPEFRSQHSVYEVLDKELEPA